MKQTAVDWLVEQYTQGNYSWEVYEQAKQMNKEQMIEAGNVCALKASVFREKLDEMSDDEKRDLLINDIITHGQEYYNETYETK